MKKYLTAILLAVMLGISVPMFATTASAQTRYYTTRTTVYRHKRPSWYRRHRNLANVLIATGAGGVIGGLLGGRRGVAWGLLGGAGAGALYTYKLNPNRRRQYRNY